MIQMTFQNKAELKFIKSWSHGGLSLKKRRKTRRPLLPKKKIHVVFKSKKATGALSLLAHQKLINRLLTERGKKYFVTIHEKVNMGNHLHLKVSCQDIKMFQNFLRTFAAILARKITGAHRANSFGRFWDGLVFTRVLHSSLEELGLRGYFEANHRERELGPQSREAYLNSFNSFIRRLKSVRAESRSLSEVVLSLE